MKTRCIAVCWGFLLVGCGPEIVHPKAEGSSEGSSGSTGVGEVESTVAPSTAATSESSGGIEESATSDGTTGEAESCLVPLTHATIQAAIDDATCPIVRVSAGEYAEQLTIDRDLELEAIGDVTIDARVLGSVIAIAGAEVTIRGTTITAGAAEQGGGIATDGALHLYGTRITGNSARQGAGIHTTGPVLDVLDGSRIEVNVAGGSDAAGGGIWASGTVVTIEASSVSVNEAYASDDEQALARGAGIHAEGGAFVQIGMDSAIVGNHVTAESNGGALAQGGGVSLIDADLRVDRARIVDNVAWCLESDTGGATGGGISMAASTIAITDSLVSGNAALADLELAPYASAHGGGLYVASVAESPRPLVITRSTVAYNRAEANGFVYGGGMSVFLDTAVDAEAWIVTSTVSGNEAISPTAAHGGGIFAYAGLTWRGAWSSVAIVGATIGENRASIGTALHLRSFVETDEVIGTVASTIIAPDVDDLHLQPCVFYAGVESGGHNIDASTPGCPLDAPSDRIGVDPRIQPLGDNGGPTPTYALLATSPARDGGPVACLDPSGVPIEIDQRGEPRVHGLACDIGAVEM